MQRVEPRIDVLKQQGQRKGGEQAESSRTKIGWNLGGFAESNLGDLRQQGPSGSVGNLIGGTNMFHEPEK